VHLVGLIIRQHTKYVEFNELGVKLCSLSLLRVTYLCNLIKTEARLRGLERVSGRGFSVP
jgi:hypothetical protein